MDQALLTLLIAVFAVVLIALINGLARRLGVAGPLLLVAVGGGIALLPFVDVPPIAPEWILIGVLPPLLYSAAVSLPAIEFRRDFAPIAGLSVVLVVVSALVLGVFFWLVIPSVGLPLGIALGAILSPTDAVATSIVKRLGISPRVVTMLEGESLLNDATALVLLRTAIAAIAAGFSLWGAVGAFAWGVLIAIAVGAVVGWLLLRARHWVRNSAAGTAISFAVPFLAYLPTEQLGGSGLVAAVVAGIVTGQGAPRRLTPEERLSDTLNWRTVELVLEGAVFLIMGLELRDIVTQNLIDSSGLWHGTWLALSALGIVLAVRAGYVSLVVWGQGRRARRMNRARLEHLGDRLDAVADGRISLPTRAHRGPRRVADPQRWLDAMRGRVARGLADIDYYQATPLGARHGSIIVWAGMRGVVTLAAAQTLPREGIEHRALLVFVAFLVALVSLMLQGFTLPAVVRILKIGGTGDESVDRTEKARLDGELRQAAASALGSEGLARRDGTAFTEGLADRLGEHLTDPPDDDQSNAHRDRLELRLIAIAAMRHRLHDLSHEGTFGTAMLRRALAELDADELSLRLRLEDE
ncbi:sodium:proton antiporter [Microbacterium kribbense]|uniref:Sodium:proton antiporter n=1 Tax=Microbacterium kribbense TaxID=433645 RepID=A0ABP7FXY2_9MICO